MADRVPLPGIVTGQRVTAVKRERSRELRSEMTQAEQQLWRGVRSNRLDGFRFRRQQIIDGFIVDFYCHAAGVVVELDGPVHAAQVDYDAERDTLLERRGLVVLRFTNERVFEDFEGVLTAIHQMCRQRTRG